MLVSKEPGVLSFSASAHGFERSITFENIKTKLSELAALLAPPDYAPDLKLSTLEDRQRGVSKHLRSQAGGASHHLRDPGKTL